MSLPAPEVEGLILEVVNTRDRWLRAFGPPIALFACMHLVIWYSAHEAGAPYFHARSFVQWDSNIYLDIAEHGYHLAPCGPNDPSHRAPTDLCGNTAWFPGYPLTVRVLARLTGIKLSACGFLISAGFCLAMLIALWNWFFEATITGANLLAFAMAGFFPGNIYYSAVFPVSMFLFFGLLSAHMLMKQRWVLCGLAGAVAASTYSTGFLLAPITAASILLDQWLLPRVRATDLTSRTRVQSVPTKNSTPPTFGRSLWRAMTSAAIVSFGFICVLVLHWRQVGHWNAFFLAEKSFHHHLSNPLHTWLVETHPYIQGTLWPPKAYSPVAGLQSIFVLGMVVLFLIFGLRSRLRTTPDKYLSIYLVAYWTLPLVAGGFVSLYRAEALLFPTVVLARHVPVPALAVLLGFCVVLTLGMDPLFFRAWLV